MPKTKEAENYIEAIGIVKEIDKVGRIVVPKEFRERLGLEDYVEMVLTAEGVLIRSSKYALIKKQ